MIVSYARFSPRRLAAECQSIEQQQSLLAAFCQQEGLELRSAHCDRNLSGGDRKRPGLKAAIAACQRGDCLLVYEWDRLGRDTLKLLSIAEELKGRRCTMRSVIEGYWESDDDPTKELFSTIMAAFAKYKRQTGAKRTSQVMRRRQANGEIMGAIPYGLKRDPADPKRMIDAADEQLTIAVMKSHRAAGETLREIARYLNTEGIRCRGGLCHHRTIGAIIKRTAAPA